jgi:hypothetical protein
MQRISTSVARVLHQRFAITMVTYLDDWLIFSSKSIPVQKILQSINDIGLQINTEKSILLPTTARIYLGLNVNFWQQQLQATPQCIRHLQFLASIIPRASAQDILRIAGYVSWL